MMMTVRMFVVLVLALCACRRSERPSPEQHANDALGRVATIEADLVKVRGLDFVHAVPAAYQTSSDFRGFVRRAVDKDRAQVIARSEALQALGLLPPGTDLPKSLEDAYATQAAAYYDPEAKKFFIVIVPDNEAMLDMTSAHELTHALQDQHFDLERYLGKQLDGDARAARRFVVEGDATLAMVMYAVYEKTHVEGLTSRQIDAIRGALENTAALDPSAMATQLKVQAALTANNDPELQKSLDAMDKIPLTILVPLLDSYMKGAVLALDAYQRGGSSAVDELFTHPPESTEQVLHPRERLFDKRDRPRHVTLPILPGYTVVDTDVLGELQWGVYFSLWKHEGDGHEEQNWGGDRYALLRGPAGKTVLVIATIWDTAEDAEVFYHAYRSTAATRFSADHPGFTDLEDDRVYIVDGGDRAMLDAIVAGTKFD